MKILTIIGARPQFIKAAALSRVLCAQENTTEIILHTGQHFDANMSEVFFAELEIPEPDYNLEVAGLSHGVMTGRMLEKIEHVLLDEKPDLVLVYGDTNSTLAGALAAVKLHVPVAHIEAGLRSFNRRMPEEINRILTDHASDLLFCPTRTAVDNLRSEGIPEKRIHLVGDVMQDAALFYAQKARKPPLPEYCPLTLESPFILATLHRAENTDDPMRLKEIFNALAEISRLVPILIPAHPRTRKKIAEMGMDISAVSNLFLIDPVGYLEMIYLLRNCTLVMTDSGGLQKEAYFFNKPCITLRDETEWVELVEHGCNLLAGYNRDSILKAFAAMHQRTINFSSNLYGAGKASQTIMKHLLAESAR